MPFVSLDSFAPGLSEDQAYEVLNTMAVDFLEFSEKSSLYARMYGVLTGAEEGNEELKDLVANSCLRTSLMDLLYEVQTDAEMRAGYPLADRFHEEFFAVIVNRKMQTTYPGIEEFNVERVWYPLDGYDEQAVTFNVITDAVIELDSGVHYVQMPVDVVGDPLSTYSRLRSDGGAFTYAATPIVERVSGTPDHWKVPIDTSKKTYTSGEVDVQDRSYVYVDITTPTLEVGQNLEPVYPGSNQIIPQAKPMETPSVGVSRYWFHPYSLVLSQFDQRTVNLRIPETYKLYPKIEFRYWVSEDFFLELVVTQGDTVTTYQFDPSADPQVSGVRAELIDPEHGIFHIVVDPGFSIVSCLSGLVTPLIPYSATFKVKYKTSPSSLEAKYRNQIVGISRAIVQRVASELPLEGCYCPITAGYIKYQQTVMGSKTTNLFTGYQVDKLEYGNKLGQIAYATFMNQILYYRPLTRVGKS